MKTPNFVLLPAICIILTASTFAAPFDCGSTGAYGPMNITNDTTLQLPPDGIFHCTTITVAQGATLRFTNNALNTPAYLLSTGDVSVNGTIDISGSAPDGYRGGLGGPGGFAGGYGGSVYAGQQQGGRGLGPGGGRQVEGHPANTILSACYAGCYGNLLLEPLLGGSGGVGNDGSSVLGGGGGGGAILIASNTRITLQGTIVSSSAGGTASPPGSGGGVRLVAPVVRGSGTVNVIGGPNYWGNAGSGRVRLDCTDNQAYQSLNLSGVASRGSRMIVFPTNTPSLDIIEVAGNSIPPGTNNAVVFELPSGTSTNQTVKVQAKNFTGDVPIRVVVTPEHGSRGEFDATILQASGNPPSATVPVIIPAGSTCQIHAWTR
jgi:hypothetical protein